MGLIEHSDENREADVSLDWMRMDRDRWRSQAEASKADADRLRSQLAGAVGALNDLADLLYRVYPIIGNDGLANEVESAVREARSRYPRGQ